MAVHKVLLVFSCGMLLEARMNVLGRIWHPLSSIRTAAILHLLLFLVEKSLLGRILVWAWLVAVLGMIFIRRGAAALFIFWVAIKVQILTNLIALDRMVSKVLAGHCLVKLVSLAIWLFFHVIHVIIVPFSLRLHGILLLPSLFLSHVRVVVAYLSTRGTSRRLINLVNRGRSTHVIRVMLSTRDDVLTKLVVAHHPSLHGGL